MTTTTAAPAAVVKGSKAMLSINAPKPTHPDMVLVQSTGHPATIQEDIAKAREAAEAIRAEREAALGPDPDCPVPIP